MKRVTEQQIQLLKNCFCRCTLAQCQMITGLSIPTIRKFAKRLNLAIRQGPAFERQWTKEQDSFIINNKGRMTTEEMAEMLGRTPNAVAIRLSRLLSPQSEKNRHPVLTPVQMKWLKENYPYRLNSYCAELLEISEEDVEFWAERMELKKWVNPNSKKPKQSKQS